MFGKRRMGGIVTKRLVVLLVSLVAVIALLVPATSSAKSRPLCVQKRVGQVHVIVGYCP